MAAPKLPSYVADFHAWFNAVEVVVLVALRSALRLEEGSESLHRSHVLSVDLAPNPAFGDGKHDSERFIVESIDTMSFDSVHREWGVPKEELEMMKARTEVMRAEVEGRKDEEAFHDHLVTISAFNLVIKKEGKVLTQCELHLSPLPSAARLLFVLRQTRQTGKFKGFSPRKIYHEYASPTIPLQSRRLNPHWKHAFELGLELTPLKKPSLRELDMVDMMRSGDDELVTRIMKEMKRKKGRK